MPSRRSAQPGPQDPDIPRSPVEPEEAGQFEDSGRFSEEDWKAIALRAGEILKALKEPPLNYATVTAIHGKTLDVVMPTGHITNVSYDPRLKNQLCLGQTVKVTSCSPAVVEIGGALQSHQYTTVKDVLKDGRLRVGSCNGDRIIQSPLFPAKIGDRVLVDAHYTLALENLGRDGKAYQLHKVPEVPWSAIGGLEDVVSQIRREIELPSKHADLLAKFPDRRPPKGNLLYGPPRCGKTLIAKAVAYNMAQLAKARGNGNGHGFFLNVSGPEFLQRYVGDGEAKIREVFSVARETVEETGGYVVIFVDEPESAFRRRGTGISTDATDSLVNQWLIEMDGINGTENIMVFLATNRHELLDPALVGPGRVDKKYYIPRPNKAGAEEIFQIYLAKLPLKKSLLGSSDLVRAYAKRAADEVWADRPVARLVYADGGTATVHYRHVFSGAAAKNIVHQACDLAIDRGTRKQDSDVTLEDLAAAVELEYRQNLDFTQQVTTYDLKSLAGDRFSHIRALEPAVQARG